MDSFLNYELMDLFDKSLFTDNKPFPHYCFGGLQRQDAFEMLVENFPQIGILKEEKNSPRKYSQRSHDRFYACCQNTHVTGLLAQFALQINELPKIWQDYINSMYSDKIYKEFISDLFRTDKFVMRFDWHMTPRENDVSPHIDSVGKVGTHIFYYMTDANWNNNWGGETLVLDDKKTKKMNPEVSDFGAIRKSEILNNKSFLFQNTTNAWHAVDKITCPENIYRRMSSIIFLKDE